MSSLERGWALHAGADSLIEAVLASFDEDPKLAEFFRRNPAVTTGDVFLAAQTGVSKKTLEWSTFDRFVNAKINDISTYLQTVGKVLLEDAENKPLVDVLGEDIDLLVDIERVTGPARRLARGAEDPSMAARLAKRTEQVARGIADFAGEAFNFSKVFIPVLIVLALFLAFRETGEK